MIAIFSIILTVAFIAAIKACATIGMDADVTNYIMMLSELKLIEVALWFILAIVGRNVVLSVDRYNVSHDSSVSIQLWQKPDGSTDERVVSRWSQTPDFEPSRKTLKQTVFVFSLAAISLVMFYTLN